MYAIVMMSSCWSGLGDWSWRVVNWSVFLNVVSQRDADLDFRG